MIEVEKMEKISEEWTGLSPNEAAENTPESAVSKVHIFQEGHKN